jgi:hypothetical protein
MSEKSTALIAIQEYPVDFHGDEINTALVEIDGLKQVYVPLRPICKYLGLSWPGQFERINRDPVLQQETRFVRVTRTNLTGGDPEVLCLPLDFLNGWLFGINANRVKAELQEKVIQYQRDCYRVLARAFQAEITQAATSTPDSTSLMQVRNMALAIASMAEQQIEMQSKITAVNARVDRAATVVADIQHRLSAVEQKVGPAAAITDEQATDISNQVKALAEMLTAKDPSKNHFQSIFSELYRRFRVSSYKLVRQDQYQTVLSFLEDWRKAAERPQQRPLIDGPKDVL